MHTKNKGLKWLILIKIIPARNEFTKVNFKDSFVFIIVGGKIIKYQNLMWCFHSNIRTGVGNL